jgi:hypothetical protein
MVAPNGPKFCKAKNSGLGSFRKKGRVRRTTITDDTSILPATPRLQRALAILFDAHLLRALCLFAQTLGTPPFLAPCLLAPFGWLCAAFRAHRAPFSVVEFRFERLDLGAHRRELRAH